MAHNTIEVHKNKTEDWKVTVVDTGLDATPGQRIRQISKYLEENECLVTYGDCLSDIDADCLIKKHKHSGKLATLVLAKPLGRKRLLSVNAEGLLDYDDMNPAVVEAAWVNADCFIFDKSVWGYLHGTCDLEEQVFQRLSEEEQIATYKHNGFWTTVETKRDLAEAENLWECGLAPWIK